MLDYPYLSLVKSGINAFHLQTRLFQESTGLSKELSLLANTLIKGSQGNNPPFTMRTYKSCARRDLPTY